MTDSRLSLGPVRAKRASVKRTIFRKMLGLSFVSLLSVWACGPVNQKPAAIAPPPADGIQSKNSTSTPAETIGYSDNEFFVVMAKLKAAEPEPSKAAADVTAESELTSTEADDVAVQPKIGKNQYEIHVVRTKGFSPTSKDFQLTVSYVHQHARIPATFDGDVKLQQDGSYLVTVFFKKKGTWKITLHMLDSDKNANVSLKDEQTISVTL